MMFLWSPYDSSEMVRSGFEGNNRNKTTLTDKDYIQIGIDKRLIALNEDRSRITYVYTEETH